MIYFIRETGTDFVKIGSTKDITERLSKLQTGNPRKLYISNTYNGDIKGERYLHSYFKEYSKHLEWFEFDKSMDFLEDDVISEMNNNTMTKHMLVVFDSMNNIIKDKNPIGLNILVKISGIDKSVVVRFMNKYRDRINTYNINEFNTTNYKTAIQVIKLRAILSKLESDIGYVSFTTSFNKSELSRRRFFDIWKLIKDEFNVVNIVNNGPTRLSANKERVLVAYNELVKNCDNIKIKDVALKAGLNRNTVSSHMRSLNLI